MVNIQNKNRNHQFSNDCNYILYSKRDLNPHSRNGQGILSPSCLPIPPFEHPRRERAENETRTRDPNLGKVMLYQLSYFRKYPLFVKEMRLELTRHNCHHPLKVARLPIPPFLQKRKSRAIVPRTGLEPACLSTHAPETCASTIPPPGHSV